MKHFQSVFLSCVSILLFFICAQADVQIKMKNESENDKDITTDVILSDNSMRIEIAGKSQNMTIIFRKDKELLWLIDNQKKTYSEMTREDLEKIKGQIEGAQKMMEEQMKNLPPEQRKMMEQMMQGKMPAPAQKVELTYTKKETGIKINQWTSTHYEVFSDAKKVKDIWTADLNQIGVSKDEFGILTEMTEFFKSIAPEDPGIFDLGFNEEEGGFSGFPIRMISYSNGKISDKMDVLEIKKNIKFEKSIFDLPEGYKKTDHFKGKFE